MRLSLLRALPLALFVFLAGCGSDSGGLAAGDSPPRDPSPGPPEVAQVASSDRVQQREIYGSSRFDPPPQSLSNAISRDYAMKVFDANSAFPPEKDAPHTVRIATYWDDEFGANVDASGRATPQNVDRLVWVLLYPQTAPVASRGPKPVELPKGTRCVFISIVDANSGEFLVAQQKCGQGVDPKASAIAS